MTSSVQIKIQFNGRYLTLPINPEDISINRTANNDDIDIIGIGKATRKGSPGLKTFSIESFFPGSKSYFYSGVLPKTCIDFINTIWRTDNVNNTVGKITTTGLPVNINMYFVIEEFTYDHKAGEEEDIYYTLSVKEYKPYGVRKVTKKSLKKSSSKSRTKSTAKKSSKSSNSRIYIVKKGDCLWNIAKKCSGKGSNWRQLYNLNKKVIGKNPNLIYPGQKLTLPAGWKNPTTTTSSKKVKKTAKKTYTKKKYTTTKKVTKAKSKTTKKTVKSKVTQNVQRQKGVLRQKPQAKKGLSSLKQKYYKGTFNFGPIKKKFSGGSGAGGGSGSGGGR